MKSRNEWPGVLCAGDVYRVADGSAWVAYRASYGRLGVRPMYLRFPDGEHERAVSEDEVVGLVHRFDAPEAMRFWAARVVPFMLRRSG